MSRTRKIAMVAILAASAAALQIIESPLPRLLPWLKPGLANAMTLFALLRISVSAGFGVAMVRTFLAGIVMGSLFSPVYLISLAGALSSAVCMSIIRKLAPESGLATLSIAGALASNWAQLMTVQLMFAQEMAIWFHLAIMIWIAIPSGLIVAGVTAELLRRT
ncbi:MAG: Gx transporter family protein [Candidatus Rifleibacteriota bacterium]